MNPYPTNSRLRGALQAEAEAKMRLDAAIAEVQLTCEHQHQAECEYRPSEFYSALPPLRICLVCGLTEQGWGIGWRVLTHHNVSVGSIDRDELYRIRQGVCYLDTDGKNEYLKRRGENSHEKVPAAPGVPDRVPFGGEDVHAAPGTER